MVLPAVVPDVPRPVLLDDHGSPGPAGPARTRAPRGGEDREAVAVTGDGAFTGRPAPKASDGIGASRHRPGASVLAAGRPVLDAALRRIAGRTGNAGEAAA